MQSMKELNYQAYLEKGIESYLGEWIVICDGEIIAHGKNAKQVILDAKRQCGDKRFLVARVPDKETMIY